MSRKHKWLLALGCIIAAGSLGILFCSSSPSQASLRLKIVGQGVDHGKRVIFFRVEAGEDYIKMSSHIMRLEKVVGTSILDQYNSLVATNRAFLAPSTRLMTHSDLVEPSKLGEDFAVVAPTNAPIWKLRVYLWLEVRSYLSAIKETPEMWRHYRQTGKTLVEAVRYHWLMVRNRNFGYMANKVIESDPITNAMPTQPLRLRKSQ